jgi:ParB family transcriptional regulator, chromosome partitioning protein
MQVKNVPCNSVSPNPEQPRRELDPGDLASLADSIRQHGVLNAIAVRECGDGYTLIDGERRWRAAVLAGLAEIPATVRPAANGTAGRDNLVQALVANIQRTDMNPIDEAAAFARLVELGYTHTSIAEMLGLQQSNVSLRLRLLKFEPEIQQLYAVRALPIAQPVIAAIENLPDASRVRVARSLAAQKATGKKIVSVCERLSNSAPDTRLQPPAPKEPTASWSMLNLINQPVPDHLARAAAETCRKCILHADASANTCADCPGLDLLRRIINPK